MVVSGCTDRGVGAAVEDRRDGTGVGYLHALSVAFCGSSRQNLVWVVGGICWCFLSGFCTVQIDCRQPVCVIISVLSRSR